MDQYFHGEEVCDGNIGCGYVRVLSAISSAHNRRKTWIRKKEITSYSDELKLEKVSDSILSI